MPRNDTNRNPNSPMKRSIADVSTNNPPEVNRQAVKAEAEARKMQGMVKAAFPNRSAYKANAPEQMRQWGSIMRKAEAAQKRRRAYTSKQFGSGGVV